MISAATKAEVNFLSPAHKHSSQHVDNSNNLVFPWFTKSFLDVLKTWDIKNWDIFEWGSGFSTVWFSDKCKSIVSIEDDAFWAKEVQNHIKKFNLKNATLKVRKNNPKANLNDGGQNSPYVNSIDEDNKVYDCIIIDGNCRNDCVKKVLNHIKPNGIIILDNSNHSAIGIDSTPFFHFLQKWTYEHHSYGLDNATLDTTNSFFWVDYTWRTDYWVVRKDHDPKNIDRLELYKKLEKAKLPFVNDVNYIVNPNTKVTLLMLAAYNNNFGLVKLLLKLGANKHLKDINGSNALLYAKNNNHKEMAELLNT